MEHDAEGGGVAEAAERATVLQDDAEPGARSTTPAGDRARRLGTFQGVFRPTVLTILGLMMYVREGWVVGNAGLLGAVLLILLTFVITGTAALALSSVTTNIHVGPGGSFSIISQSLGLETGGSIGVPLYLGQALSSALYIYGFAEAWRYIFPGHPELLVVYSVFAVALATTLVSTRLAFRLQGVVMAIILISTASIVLGLTTLFGGDGAAHRPELWGTFEDAGFWVLFAIFFPAGTGVQVGASMSGALENPRKSIPRGTLAAVGTALVVYLGMAVWYSVVAAPEALRANPLIVLEEAAVGEVVLAGILASTFTATLSGLVAAPRVLQALAEHDIVPRSGFFRQLTEDGEPRNAMLATAVLVAAAMLLGSLNAVAQLITMFFLLIYLTLNAVVAIEKALGLVSFRPTFDIPFWVPVVGIVSCMLALFIISPMFALVALGFVLALYIYLVARRLETPWQTVRSSIFVSLADWASKQATRTAGASNERAWKPDLLVPVTSRGQLDGVFRFLRLLAEPKGSLKIVGIRPTEPTLQAFVDIAAREEMGVALLYEHPEAAFGQERRINVWISDQSPEWGLGLRLPNLDLSLLLAYQVWRNWNARLRLLTACREASEIGNAHRYLDRLTEDARLPGDTQHWVTAGAFLEKLAGAPEADLSVLGLAREVDKPILEQIVHRTRSSCLFVRDSGHESALA